MGRMFLQPCERRAIKRNLRLSGFGLSDLGTELNNLSDRMLLALSDLMKWKNLAGIRKPKPVLENYYRIQVKIDHIQLDRMTGELSDVEADRQIEEILSKTDNYLPF